MFFFRGDLALAAFVVATLFLIAFARVKQRQPRRRGALWLLGVAVAAWFGYGLWEWYLARGDYLRLDIVYLWPFLLLVSVVVVVWTRFEDRDGADQGAAPDRPRE
jgi:hypothetical protein